MICVSLVLARGTVRAALSALEQLGRATWAASQYVACFKFPSASDDRGHILDRDPKTVLTHWGTTAGSGIIDLGNRVTRISTVRIYGRIRTATGGRYGSGSGAFRDFQIGRTWFPRRHGPFAGG